jgi:hypothetical protein
VRYNLLKCVQLILSSMDSDEVNSIVDTTEAGQVVDILETTYNDIISTIDFPDLWDFFELEASEDVTRPTLMYLPDDVAKLEWVKYNIAPAGDTVRDWRDLIPLEREAFFRRMNSMDSADTTVESYEVLVGAETFNVRSWNDRWPTYYTTFDDHTLIFDAYMVSESTTLVKNQTHCYGMKIPTFTREDDWTPPLDPRQFTLFFNEAKSQAFIELKQVANAKADQRARRAWVQSGRKKAGTPAGHIKDTYTYDFGRRRQK